MQHSVLQVGLLGLGHVAQHHCRALDAVEGIALAAVCDLDAARRRSQANVAGFADLESMVAACSLDLVIVATPNSDHIGSVSRLLGAGIDVVVEKPAAENRQDLQRMFDLAVSTNSYLDVALHSAFGKEVSWLVEHLGDLVGSRPLTGFHCELFDPYVEGGALRQGVAGLGGSWIDCGINALSVIARFMSPSGLTISHAEFTHDPTLRCSDTASRVSLEFPAGCGTMHTDWRLGVDRKVTFLQFEDVEIELHHSNEQVIRRADGVEEICYTVDNSLPRLTNHYIGVFTDLVQRYPKSNNLVLAAQLHARVYDAQDAAAASD